jgi:NAD(P)-dependent dehydrogenase (short-subunit alcohol dehydrogenase family)
MAKARWQGQVAWVTGGGTGIGRALALALADQGADVAVSGRRKDRLEEVAREIESRGRRAIAIACDVTEDDGMRAAADGVVRGLGKLDVCIANAGYAVAGPIESLSVEEWRRQLDVNVIGVAITARHALPYLRESRGRFGLVGSVAAFVPIARNGAYCASKYAVRAIGQVLSIELAGSGVSCTALHPGFVESEIAQVDNLGVHHAERDDHRPKRLMWSAPDAAETMLDALWRRKKEHVFTAHGKVGAFLGQHVPGLIGFAQARSRKRIPSKRG